MASRALAIWDSAQRRELDRLDAAHLAVGGVGPGRRTGTQQINDAYLVLLAAHFQQFCRDLHTEAAEFLAASAPRIRGVVRDALLARRTLDRGNAAPSALGADFGRLGLELWAKLDARDKRNAARRIRLQQLTTWRNAIAHQDFQFEPAVAARLAGTRRTLAFARHCRSACEVLARELDAVVGTHLHAVVGTPPW
jgi:hypothetical protein